MRSSIYGARRGGNISAPFPFAAVVSTFGCAPEVVVDDDDPAPRERVATRTSVLWAVLSSGSSGAIVRSCRSASRTPDLLLFARTRLAITRAPLSLLFRSYVCGVAPVGVERARKRTNVLACVDTTSTIARLLCLLAWSRAPPTCRLAFLPNNLVPSCSSQRRRLLYLVGWRPLFVSKKSVVDPRSILSFSCETARRSSSRTITLTMRLSALNWRAIKNRATRKIDSRNVCDIHNPSRSDPSIHHKPNLWNRISDFSVRLFSPTRRTLLYII